LKRVMKRGVDLLLPEASADSLYADSAEFHSFVRPTSFPKLSDFCKDFTGIKQASFCF